jgi:hypothetical protein
MNTPNNAPASLNAEATSLVNTESLARAGQPLVAEQQGHPGTATRGQVRIVVMRTTNPNLSSIF